MEPNIMIEFRNQKGVVITYSHDSRLIYRVEWDDCTVDLLQKTAEGKWKDLIGIPKKHHRKIGQIIDRQVND